MIRDSRRKMHNVKAVAKNNNCDILKVAINLAQ